MSDYFKFCESFKDSLQVEFKRCINDVTMKESYFVCVNVFCRGIDFHLTEDVISVGYSKKEARKIIQRFTKILGKKPRLFKTVNSLGYTRLVYRF